MNPITDPIPLADRCLEGYIEGAIFEFGPCTVSEEEIIDFAQRYDPQTMHTDAAVAAHGPFKGLMASGWHTASLMMRLFVDNFLSPTAGLPSPGIRDLRWKKPVRPGDQLRLRLTVLEARASLSNAERGIVTTRLECVNQKDEIAMIFTAANLVFKRAHLSSAA